MAYRIELRPRAARDLAKLPRKAQERIAAAIDALGENPRPAGVTKLKAKAHDLYRIRVGSYRVIYAVDERVQIITVARIGDRKDIYRM